MGNRSRAALVAGGVFFIGVAALARFYAYPALAVAPSDQIAQTVSAGPDAVVFDSRKLSEVQLTLESIRNVKGDPAASEKASEEIGRDVVVFDTSVVTDEPGYVLSEDPEKLPRSFLQERVVLDANTGEAVQAPSAGEYVTKTLKEADREEVSHKGLVLKFPFGTEKKTYDFWDSTTRKAYPIEFKGEDTLEGLKVYRFEQAVPTQVIATIKGVPGSVVGDATKPSVEVTRDYTNNRTIWVEPATGAIIKGQEKQYSTLQYNGEAVKRATAVTIAYNDETVKKNVDGVKRADGTVDGGYKAKAQQLNLIKTVIPIGGLLLGLALLGLAAVLHLRQGPRPTSAPTGMRRRQPVG